MISARFRIVHRKSKKTPCEQGASASIASVSFSVLQTGQVAYVMEFSRWLRAQAAWIMSELMP